MGRSEERRYRRSNSGHDRSREAKQSPVCFSAPRRRRDFQRHSSIRRCYWRRGLCCSRRLGTDSLMPQEENVPRESIKQIMTSVPAGYLSVELQRLNVLLQREVLRLRAAHLLPTAEL